MKFGITNRNFVENSFLLVIKKKVILGVRFHLISFFFVLYIKNIFEIKLKFWKKILKPDKICLQIILALINSICLKRIYL
jgi:hypothetical protein